MKKLPKNKASVQDQTPSTNTTTPPSKQSEPTKIINSSEVQAIQDNQRQANVRWFKNHTTTITGSFEITQYEDGFEFHLVNPQLWNVTKQQFEPLSQDSNKFKTSASTLSACKSIFWTKWTIYCQKRFGRKISLEVQNITQFDTRNNVNRSHEKDHTQVRTQHITHSSEFESSQEIVTA